MSAPSDGGTGERRARNRLHVAQPPEGGRLALTGDAAHRVGRVLRLGTGARIDLFDGSGRSWDAVVESTTARVVMLSIGAATPHAPPPVTVLITALIKASRFEWLIEKATELGVTAVQPVVCERSAVRPTEIGRTRLERWRRIAIEAAEQCGRYSVPAIEEPQPLAAALAALAGRCYVAAEPAHGRALPLGQALREIDRDPVSLLVGPEGGLTGAELRAAEAAGGVAVSLGPLVLRAETAAIAALAILADARSRVA